jgi:hypothetical protein
MSKDGVSNSVAVKRPRAVRSIMLRVLDDVGTDPSTGARRDIASRWPSANAPFTFRGEEARGIPNGGTTEEEKAAAASTPDRTLPAGHRRV